MKIQKNLAKISLAVVASFAAWVGLVQPSVVQAAVQGGPSFSQIATQPSAMAENDGWNKAIHSIAFDGNKLIAGYGDWNTNSDSFGSAAARVGIEPLDLGTNTWQPKTPLVGTESIDRIRTIDGALYVPTIDPSNYGSGGYATNATGKWVVNSPPITFAAGKRAPRL